MILPAGALGATLVLGGAAVSNASPSSPRLANLVGGETMLFARRDNTVLSFDSEGRQIRAREFCGVEPPPQPSAHLRGGAVDADAALRLAGLPDDEDQTSEAEDVFSDEGLAGRRLTGGWRDGPIEVRALAADRSSNDVWIATSSGLFRGRDGSCAPVGLRGHDLQMVAVRGGVLAVAGDTLVWRRGEVASSFTVAAGLVIPPRALAVSPDGQLLVADSDGVLEIGTRGSTRRLLPGSTDAIAICGGLAASLTGSAVYTWSPGGVPARAGDRPPARQLACGAAPETRFLATGVGVWTSGDGGSWIERSDWLGRPVDGAATIATGSWVAVGGRLARLEEHPPPRGLADPFPTDARQAPGQDWAPLPTARLTAPTFPWPAVTVLFAAQQTPTRAGWSIEVLFAFPLGRRGLHRADKRLLARELVARDAALAREETELSSSPGPDGGNGARLDFVRRERQALR